MVGAEEPIEWDEAAFQAALERAREGVIVAPGVRLSSEQLAELLAAAPEARQRPYRELREAKFYRTTFSGDAAFTEATFSGDAGFTEATFSGDADFSGTRFSGDADFGATFEGESSFDGAIFEGDTRFDGAIFSGDASFGGASLGGDASFFRASFGGDASFLDAVRFGGHASFLGASFGGDASFLEPSFGGDASFDGASFAGHASFLEPSFGGDASFPGASFGGDADFDGASFGGDASFRGASFGGDASFLGATFGGEADFARATFEQAREFGPVLVFGELELDLVVFAQPVRIAVSARRASLDRAVFRTGADVFARWAELSLEDADFAEPSLMAELPATLGPEGKAGFLGWEQPVADGRWVCRLDRPPTGFTPRLASARRAKAAQLTLSGVDLRAARFAGAHGLDGLRLERTRFAQPPSRKRPPWGPPRWTRRQTLAEEHHWRAQHGYGPGWYEGDITAPDWLEQASEPPEAEEIAAIYRDLRKAREDNKDESGAADFYYGEMEMRRHTAKERRRTRRIPGIGARRIPGSEEVVLWPYWLVSGYGLRASRAILALAVTCLLFATLFSLGGIRGGASFGHALIFSVQSTTSLFRAPQENLSDGGKLLEIGLRLLGPLFFGLALLSLRGRVKR